MDGRSEFGMGCVAEDYVFVWNGVEIRFCGGFLSTDGGRGGSVRLRLLQSTANSETPRRRREENSIPNVIEAKGFLAEGGGLDGSPGPRRSFPLCRRLIDYLNWKPIHWDVALGDCSYARCFQNVDYQK
uniref:Uncharacterized protein LOC105050507 n=1 Tax=Elaeis guineensis var. tenera TaxID=51953 RepID=A0A8N4EZV3_ELAGV|nr:uncharacterized protein LOC105050507 [Elaeis guineensis]